MTTVKDIIQHPGEIERIDGEKLYVNILSKSACSSCHAKGACSVSDMENKIVEIWKDADEDYQIGQEVTVFMKKSLGPKAVYFGYLYPFIVVLVSLIVLISVTGHEGISALISLALLAPYYLVLYKLKDKMSKTFEFKIRK